MWEEFKKFAFKGNLIDMAIGIIMGGAFATVATSFVEDIIMPPLAHLAGGASWENQAYVIGGGALEGTPEEIAKAKETLPVIAWGSFLTNLVSFIIIALVMFIVMKKILGSIKMLEPEKAPDPGPTGEEKLLTEIRDLLKKS